MRPVPEFHAKSPLTDRGDHGSMELIRYIQELSAALREARAELIEAQADVTALEAEMTAAQATIADHETRITALEP